MKKPMIGVTPLWDAERQSVWMLPDYLDGIIEAAQMLGKRFFWAVQWHPEYLFRTDKYSLAVFSCFVEHCCR
ncbi:MAG: gamma-glutamyl-gamma-aminobutyrate hydrolase family protein [Bacteroidales bacterium]|nr:gamma-glutamyl-gamma-aminobutyrate hydrolase family protein [Bacteroidales bacterium]